MNQPKKHEKNVEPANEIFARHLLATRRQQLNKTSDEFLQSLKAF